MEQAADMSRMRVHRPGGGHERRLFYDRLGRYLFIAAACLMTVIIFSIIFFVGRQGLMTFANVSPLEFFTAARWSPTAATPHTEPYPSEPSPCPALLPTTSSWS